MWAVRTFLALDPRRRQQRSDMNNDRGDRPMDLREMAEVPRTSECDQPDKHLLDREESRYSRTFRPGMDMNLYATKKSVAQGMMDIALLTANASQLKYILKDGDAGRFYLVNVICITISIILQLVVGVLLILNTRYNINLISHQSRAEMINNLTIIGIFLITVSNVFVSAFGTPPR
ncbi:ninjurin-2-like [Uloborus diversus]|uniref:ninjurin-2-like n=1 Tax=Uloborus diversus TaxID=327109 RepID=UPI00240A416C|nr:ninjurin-2-like [Uloborus diversus]